MSQTSASVVYPPEYLAVLWAATKGLMDWTKILAVILISISQPEKWNYENIQFWRKQYIHTVYAIVKDKHVQGEVWFLMWADQGVFNMKTSMMSFTMCCVQSQSLCHPLERASVQFSQCGFWESTVSCNMDHVYLTCAVTKTRKKERWSEIFCCQMESSGYGFRDSSWAATQPQYDITLPSVFSGEMIRSELVLCVSAHLPTHQQAPYKSLQESPPLITMKV